MHIAYIMAINVNEGGVVKGITTDITAFISAIDLIAEDFPLTSSKVYNISLDYDYRCLLILHNMLPFSGNNNYSRVGSQLISMKGLISHSNSDIGLSSAPTYNNNYGYRVKCDTTGRQLTITAGSSSSNICPSITILGVR